MLLTLYENPRAGKIRAEREKAKFGLGSLVILGVMYAHADDRLYYLTVHADGNHFGSKPRILPAEDVDIYTGMGS